MKNRRILVTGASRGIGFEIAKSIADTGNLVIATARSVDALENLKTHSPDRIETISADLTDPSDVISIAEFLNRNKFKLDGLIHNAGLLINKPFTDLSDTDWQKMLDVNLMAPVRLTRTLTPFMNSGSHIVMISSMGGYQESSKFPGLSGYSTAKGGISILSECLSVELSEHKISVNCLCLGAVQTEMLEEAFPGFTAPVSAQEMGKYIAGFTLEAHHFFNGKILPVALADPG
jgi:3-oxoacyl-[acyl-carrier protein] reductase